MGKGVVDATVVFHAELYGIGIFASMFLSAVTNAKVTVCGFQSCGKVISKQRMLGSCSSWEVGTQDVKRILVPRAAKGMVTSALSSMPSG